MIHLYVKTHNTTGLKYFGKTTKLDPEKYKGSGKRWLKHLSKHGNDVSTIIIGSYYDEEQCRLTALEFSKEHNIVNSENWANLREENGSDGAPNGCEGFTSKTKWMNKGGIDKRIKESNIDYYINQGWSLGRHYKRSEETNIKFITSNKGKKRRPFSETHKKNISDTVKGKVVVKDTISGETFRCNKSDPHYISGRYVSIHKDRMMPQEQKDLRKNKIVVKDTTTGKIIQCDKNDPKYINGTYVGATKGRKEKCKYCDKEASPGMITRWHNRNCKHYKEKKEEVEISPLS